jgi:hypothetical protein
MVEGQGQQDFSEYWSILLPLVTMVANPNETAEGTTPRGICTGLGAGQLTRKEVPAVLSRHVGPGEVTADSPYQPKAQQRGEDGLALGKVNPRRRIPVSKD